MKNKLNKLLILPIIATPLCAACAPLITSCASGGTTVTENEVIAQLPTRKSWTISAPTTTLTKDQDYRITCTPAKYNDHAIYKIDESIRNNIILEYTYDTGGGTSTNQLHYEEEKEAIGSTNAYYINFYSNYFEIVIPTRTVNNIKTMGQVIKHFYDKPSPIYLKMEFGGNGVELSDSLTWTDIGEMVGNNSISNYLNVGDYKKMSFSGDNKKVQIVSFGNYYGSSKSQATFKISFSSYKAWNDYASCSSYINSSLYSYINSELLTWNSAIYDNMKQYPKEVSKKVIKYDSSRSKPYYVDTYSTKFFVPSLANIFSKTTLQNTLSSSEQQHIETYMEEGGEGLFDLFSSGGSSDLFWTSTPVISSSGSKAYFSNSSRPYDESVSQSRSYHVFFAM